MTTAAPEWERQMCRHTQSNSRRCHSRDPQTNSKVDNEAGQALLLGCAAFSALRFSPSGSNGSSGFLFLGGAALSTPRFSPSSSNSFSEFLLLGGAALSALRFNPPNPTALAAEVRHPAPSLLWPSHMLNNLSQPRLSSQSPCDPRH